MVTLRSLGRLLCSLALAAPLALSSCFLLPREEEILAPPLAEPPQITYRTHAVARGDLRNTIRAFGSFVSASASDVFFERRGGRLRELHVKIGDEVSAGQLLAELYTDDLDADIVQSRLNLERAELALRRATEQADDRFTLEFARADRDLAVLRLEELEADLARELELAEVTGGAGETVRRLRQRVAEQGIAVRKAVLTVQRIEESENPIAVQMARVDVEAARVHLQRLIDQRDTMRLYAPIDGVVTWINRQVREGEHVPTFLDVLRIADPTDLVFEYQGRDAGRFEIGMDCVVSVRDAEYPGTVVLTPRSVPFEQIEQFRDTVRIVVEEPIPDMRIGMSATAQLVLAERNDVLVLPSRAVQRYATRRYVHVLADGVRVERDVEVGLETPTEVEIVRGLEEGEEVVLR